MLDASGYGCLAAHKKGERHSASSYEFVTVCSSAAISFSILFQMAVMGQPAAQLFIICVYRCADIITGTKKRLGSILGAVVILLTDK